MGTQMVRVRTHKTTTTKTRVKKGSMPSGYKQCNMCHGTGKVKK